jgi:hypothetical protein
MAAASTLIKNRVRPDIVTPLMGSATPFEIRGSGCGKENHDKTDKTDTGSKLRKEAYPGTQGLGGEHPAF